MTVAANPIVNARKCRCACSGRNGGRSVGIEKRGMVTAMNDVDLAADQREQFMPAYRQGAIVQPG